MFKILQRNEVEMQLSVEGQDLARQAFVYLTVH